MADEVQGTPLVSQEMLEAQPAPEEMVLPTNADVIANEDETDKDSKTGEGDGNADAKTDDGGADNSANPQAQAEEVVYEEVADPGEFTPGDYSFEVQIYDAEGKNPKVTKITSLEQWDELLESDPNLGNSAAVAKAFRAQSKMDRGQEDDKKQWEKAKAEYDEAVKGQETREAQTMQWQNELDYLVSKNELPPMPKEFHVSTANWADPEVAKQPAVKAQMDLLAYFRTENATRAKAKLAPMTSLLDAYQGFARQQEKAQNQSNRQANITARKEAGAKVASSSPRPATAAPRGVSVGRTGVLD
jgi:hypothetical protein